MKGWARLSPAWRRRRLWLAIPSFVLLVAAVSLLLTNRVGTAWRFVGFLCGVIAFVLFIVLGILDHSDAKRDDTFWSGREP